MRAGIDRIDEAIAGLVGKRLRAARHIALLKDLTDLPPRDGVREASVRTRYLRSLSAARWPDDIANAWIDALLAGSRAAQSRIAVAFQGGPGSWSEESLRCVLPQVKAVGRDSFRAAWRACRRGQATAAWLPVWNSQLGALHEAQPPAQEAEAWMECTYPIRHALLAPPGTTLEGIRRVEGHPRALEQCRQTLSRLLGRTELVASVDGAHSAARGFRDGSTAVVASPKVGVRLGWTILHASAADAADNRTTFRLYVPRSAR